MINLLYLTIQGTILTLFLVGFKNIFIKRYGGSWYYYIWILVLISFCFPYKIDIVQYFLSTSTAPQKIISVTPNVISDNLTDINFFDNNTLILKSSSIFKSVIPKLSLKQIICFIYFMGIFTFSIYYILSYFNLLKSLKNSTLKVINKDYLDCLNNVCSEMHIAQNIILDESPNITSPIFIGIINPHIILPIRSFELTDLSMIFSHELTHYKRKDMIYKLVSLIVCIIHWFNPFSYLALHNINEACEYSCDEIVTKGMSMENKKKYGYMLLNQIQMINDNFLLLAKFSPNSKNKKILTRRIRIIMNYRKHKPFFITLITVFILILCSNFFALTPINAQNIISNTKISNIDKLSIRQIATSDSENTKSTDTADNTIEEYLSKIMTQEELQLIYKFIDNSKYEADVSTRSLTTLEQNRIRVLQQKYTNESIRPEGVLPISKENNDFYLDLDSGIYHYPERELTDNELLQLIEWRLKINYALSLRYTKPLESIKTNSSLNETEVIEIAKKSVENLFNVDANNLEINAKFYDEKSVTKGWIVQLNSNKSDEGILKKNPNTDWNYMVWLNPLTNEVQTTASNPTYKWIPITQDDKEAVYKDRSWIEKAKSIVVENQQESSKIVSAYIVNMDKESTKEQQTIDIKILLENGDSYVVSLFYPDKSLRGLLYSPKN